MKDRETLFVCLFAVLKKKIIKDSIQLYSVNPSPSLSFSVSLSLCG